jgi:hypothetical protein
MKGNQNYFDENFEKEAESNKILQNQAKKNNIKISLDTNENLHYFNDDFITNPVKEMDNSRQNNKSIANSKKSKSALRNQDAENELEHTEVKNGYPKKSNNHSLKQEHNELIDYDNNEYQANFQQEKNKNTKSKKSLSNNFSNGILEEVGNSKFIIRTNFLDEDDIQENRSNKLQDQSKQDCFIYCEEKNQECDLHLLNHQNKNSSAVDLRRKKPVFIN